MGRLRRLHAAVWGAATIALLALWLRSYSIDRPDELDLLMPLEWGRVSFASLAGRVTTNADFGWNWPTRMEFGPWPYSHTAGFGVQVICSRLYVTAPHWFFILLSAAAARHLAGPARRFNLRSLLVLTAVLAILLGSWVAADRAMPSPEASFW